MSNDPAPGGEPDFAWSSRLPEATSGKPLWIVTRQSREFCLGANPAATLVKQAAPGAFPRFPGLPGALAG
jgi:hypothetical protein